MKDFSNDIPRSVAVNAFSGISMSPEKRADAVQAEYVGYMETLYERLLEIADTDEKKGILEEEFERFRAGYVSRYKAYLFAKSRCLSPMVTGPSNFPTRRNEKRFATERRRSEELDDFTARALKAIRKKLRPELAPIMSGDSDAVERLKAKIATEKAAQEKMKAANAAIRKFKATGYLAQVAGIMAAGFTEQQAQKLLEPDFCGRLGFPAYALQNNGANIRRMEQRLAKISQDKVQEISEIEGESARIEDCPAENRVRLFFPGKPSEEIRAKLKSGGFRWSPTIGCWQAYRNYRTDLLAKEIAGVNEQPEAVSA